MWGWELVEEYEDKLILHFLYLLELTLVTAIFSKMTTNKFSRVVSFSKIFGVFKSSEHCGVEV